MLLRGVGDREDAPHERTFGPRRPGHSGELRPRHAGVRQVRRVLLLGMLALLSLPPAGLADETESASGWGILSGFRFQPSFGARILDLDLKRSSDGQEADLTDYPGDLYLSLVASTPDYVIAQPLPGHTIAFKSYLEYLPFHLEKQNYYDSAGVEQNERIGTSASGSFAYLAVALLDTADLSGERPGKKMTYGIGTGYGRLRASGTAIYAPGRRLASAGPREPISVDAVGFGGFFFFLDVWLDRDVGGGMRIFDQKFRQPGLTASSDDFVLYVKLSLAAH
jgi:hypothetical protein